MTELPSGTVTFLFTDIEGSTARWEQHPEAMQAALIRHDALLRQAIAAHRGHVFKTVGDGLAAFATAPAAAASDSRTESVLRVPDRGPAGYRPPQLPPWREIGTLTCPDG